MIPGGLLSETDKMAENFIMEEDGEFLACYSNGLKGQTFDTYGEAESFMDSTGESWVILQ